MYLGNCMSFLYVYIIMYACIYAYICDCQNVHMQRTLVDCFCATIDLLNMRAVVGLGF